MFCSLIKQVVFCFFLFAASVVTQGDVILSWENSVDIGETAGTPNLIEGVAGGELTRGPNLSTDRFNSSSAIFAASRVGTAVDPGDNDYFEFTITPDVGKKLNLEEFRFSTRGDNGGPANWSVRTSLDGFTDAIYTNIGQSQGNNSVDLTGASFDDLTSAISFRIYLAGRTGGSGAGGALANAGNGTQLLGTVTPVPEPSALVLALSGLALIMRRDR